jgi:hypothetical protein
MQWSRIGTSVLLQAVASLDLLLVEEWMSGGRAFVALLDGRGAAVMVDSPEP